MLKIFITTFLLDDMNIDSIRVIKLESHDTKDIVDKHVNGNLTVIWRDWDSVIGENPKMIYITSINPGEVKGPHLHTKRDSFMTCILGRVVFIVKDLEGVYHEIICDEKEPVLLCIPKEFASAHINISNKSSSILVLANVSWMPNDNEMKNVLFDDYDWIKWKNYVS